jgi:predicted ATPase
MGDFTQACHYLQRAIDLCDDSPAIASHLRFGMDNRVALIFLAWSLAILGYPLQAREMAESLLAHAIRGGHSLTVAWAQIGSMVLAEWRRDLGALDEDADRLVAHCAEHRIGLCSDYGRIGQGLAQCWSGNPASAIDALRTALIGLEGAHVMLLRSMHLGFLAEIHASNGEREVALAVLDEAIALADTTEERFFEPELHRRRGELLMAQDRSAAEDSLHRALSIARQQGAKAWELRAAMSLARLWRDQGKREEARNLLAPVCNWFTEGFDTSDLVEAKVMLEQLQ